MPHKRQSASKRRSVPRGRRRPAGSRRTSSLTTRQRWLRIARTLPLSLHLLFASAIVAGFWYASNGVYQALRKPSELFFPVADALHKTPTETWRAYGRLFERHSTASIEPGLLAALAQVEGSGNPLVRTYWRWSWSAQPYAIYRPASSAVGMYQITDGTFTEARRYCIRDHVAVEVGPWHDWDACWFNALYLRTLPSHAVEMTSAYLDVKLNRILERHRIRSATSSQKRDLAAVIHLCGAGAGARFARRGFPTAPGQRCGDHDLGRYLEKVRAMQATFERVAVSTAD
jgi:hypothetical protein